MRTIRILTICCLLAGVLVSCENRKSIFVPYDESVRDYSPVVSSILESHPRGKIRLLFENKEYHFFPDSLQGTYLVVSNNDNGIKRVAFDIKDAENVIIDGQGAQFLFHGGMVPFSVSRSRNVSIRRLTVDYQDHFTLEGSIVQSDPENKSFTMRIRDDNPYRISGDTLFFQGYDWELPLGENIVFDPLTRRPCYNTATYEHWSAKQLHAEEISPGIVRFSGIHAREVPPEGSVWVDKGPHGQNRRYPGIILSSSHRILIEDVSIRHCGAMALIAQNSSDIRLSGFSTAQKEGCDRMITASADATHFVDCYGAIVLEDCIFESMLDDATNLHGTYMLLTEIYPDKRFAASFGHFQQEGNLFAEVGDSIRFIDRTSLKPIGTGVVLSVDRQEESRYVFETISELPENCEPGKTAVENISKKLDRVEIKHCAVRFNRARSLLISCPGDVLVEDCYFSSMMAGIRICGDANYWFESGPTDCITIRNNRFNDIGIGGAAPQAILQIDPIIPKEARGLEHFFHKKIVFEGNHVETFDRQVIYALSVDSLIIKNNLFVDSRTYHPLFPNLSVLDAQFCGHLIMSGNDFDRWTETATISLHNCRETEIEASFPIVDSPNPYFFQQ